MKFVKLVPDYEFVGADLPRLRKFMHSKLLSLFKQNKSKYAKILSLREKGEYPSGLSAETISKISDYCKKNFDCALPEDYAKFLAEANGFHYDDYTVCCCYNEEIETKFSGRYTRDLVKFNHNVHENDITDYLMLGASSLDYVAFEKSTGKYLIMTNGTMTVMNESYDFADLLEIFFKVKPE